MSGRKQPAVVKQITEVVSKVYFTAEALLSAIDNLRHWVVSQESRFTTVGDPHQQEANKLQIWRRKYVAVKQQTGHRLAVFYCRRDLCLVSVILPSATEAQTEVIQGMAHALYSTTPTLTSQLTQIPGAAGAPHTDRHLSQTWCAQTPGLWVCTAGLFAPAMIYRLVLTRLQPLQYAFSFY